MIVGVSTDAMSAAMLRRSLRAKMFREWPRIIVIGGQCRNVGKTALAVDVIRAFPGRDWLAVKITQHHMLNDDSAGYRFRAETDRSGRSDSSRFLAAGAARSFLLEASPAHLGEAITELGTLMNGAENVIIESNVVLDYVSADLAILVLDPRRPDFKASAQRLLGIADGFVLRAPLFAPNWPSVDTRMIRVKASFLQPIRGHLPIRLRRRVQRALGK
ncbi:MAG TPA: hypothetical protein VKT50_09475 [Candidatus Acidoferrales bacterium]|nr:hypothetical protein [Candidatus Acidoferrales bacterium]